MPPKQPPKIPKKVPRTHVMSPNAPVRNLPMPVVVPVPMPPLPRRRNLANQMAGVNTGYNQRGGKYRGMPIHIVKYSPVMRF